MREVRRGIERNAFRRYIGQIFVARNYDWVAGRRERGGGAISDSLCRAIFSVGSKIFRLFVATPGPLDRAHLRRHCRAGVRDAAALDGIAAKGDDVSPVDRADLSGGRGGGNYRRFVDDAVHDAESFWRGAARIGDGVAGDDVDCMGGDFARASADAQGMDGAVVSGDVCVRDISGDHGQFAGFRGAAGKLTR